MKALRLLLPALILTAASVSAATIAAVSPTAGSTTDLFNGANIDVSTALISSNARDMFGVSTSTPEPGDTIFADTGAGVDQSVTFSFGGPNITIGGYELYLFYDVWPLAPNNNRSATRFRLFQGATLLSDVSILGTGASYEGVYGGSFIKVSDTFANVTAGQFTAVFTTNNGNNPGVRVIELDALNGTATPEPTTMALLGLGSLALIAARRRKA